MENMQETLQLQVKAYPWLFQMVKSKLFHESCDQHITKKRCYYCCDCMISPLCDVCYKNSNHKNHTTIQTYKCSHQSGVRTKTISNYMDISGIHTYTINSCEIVFINQRRDNDNHRCRKNATHKCVVCKWELDATSALVCSIECKFRFALGPQLDDLMENSEVTDQSLAKKGEDSEVVEPLMKKQRHKRKGSPHRAPFY